MLGHHVFPAPVALLTALHVGQVSGHLLVAPAYSTVQNLMIPGVKTIHK